MIQPLGAVVVRRIYMFPDMITLNRESINTLVAIYKNRITYISNTYNFQYTTDRYLKTDIYNKGTNLLECQ